MDCPCKCRRNGVL